MKKVKKDCSTSVNFFESFLKVFSFGCVYREFLYEYQSSVTIN